MTAPQELIEFCFDESFYPTLLGKLHPVERYGLYCTIKDITPFRKRTEVFSLSRTIGFGSKRPYGIPAEAIKKRLQAQIDTGSEEYKEFMQRFSPMPSQLDMTLRFPNFLNISYECSTLYEMLMLEFTKMLEHSIRFKKCKNCGRYFILKRQLQNRLLRQNSRGRKQGLPDHRIAKKLSGKGCE